MGLYGRVWRFGNVRRSIMAVAVLLTALGAAARLPVARAAPLSGGRSRPAIICPVLATRASSPLCCGPPVARPSQPPCCPSNAAARPAVQPICCPVGAGAARSAALAPLAALAPSAALAPACCPATCHASITIGSTPNPARAGQPVTVEGLVEGGGGGVPVALWQRRAGQRSFSEVATTTTSASGAYVFRRPADSVMRDTYWYAAAGAKRSATIEELVRAIVTLRASTVRARPGAIVHLFGTVRPRQRGRRVEVLARVGRGRWRVVARPLLLAGGRFACRLQLRKAGRWRLRALVASDAANLQGDSRTITFTVP